jgi:hypothetical protein
MRFFVDVANDIIEKYQRNTQQCGYITINWGQAMGRAMKDLVNGGVRS